jgi:sterol desaturase/sphingolipid hydroxylase (fatty acid hydroxylase superfamily)
MESAQNSATVSRIPFPLYKRQQAQIAKRRLFPTTLFYSTYCITIVTLALRSRHPLVAVFFFAAGVVNWTLVEYLFHRYVLHRHFADGKGIFRKFAHRRLDPLHFEHHERPWDALHITGTLKDLLPLFFVAAPLSFIAPIYTLPILLAATVEGYIAEEWVHYTIHFCKIKNPYFRYVKRFHLYHHSPKGETIGYGITGGFWDFVFGTRYPEPIRENLFSKKLPNKGGRRNPDLPIGQTAS